MHATRSIMLITSVCALALTFTATPQAHAAVVTDTFTLVSPNRDAGDPLVGTQTETGGLTWVGHPSLPLGGDANNGYVRQPGPQSYYAYVPVTASAAGAPILKVSAQVRFSGDGGTSNIGVAFVNQPTNMITLTNGTNFVVRSDGTWFVRFSGQGQQATGTVAGFDPLVFNTLEFILDRTNPAQRVTALINGQVVLNNSQLLQSFPISYAGFQFTSAPTDSAVDNFVLEIPEPGTAAAFGALLLIPALRRRRSGKRTH